MTGSAFPNLSGGRPRDAVFRHGLPEDKVSWTLDVDKRAENPTQVRRKAGEEPKLRECPQVPRADDQATLRCLRLDARATRR
jgi:hypothetical protein